MSLVIAQPYKIHISAAIYCATLHFTNKWYVNQFNWSTRKLSLKYCVGGTGVPDHEEWWDTLGFKYRSKVTLERMCVKSNELWCFQTRDRHSSVWTGTGPNDGVGEMLSEWTSTHCNSTCVVCVPQRPREVSERRDVDQVTSAQLLYRLRRHLTGPRWEQPHLTTVRQCYTTEDTLHCSCQRHRGRPLIPITCCSSDVL